MNENPVRSVFSLLFTTSVYSARKFFSARDSPFIGADCDLQDRTFRLVNARMFATFEGVQACVFVYGDVAVRSKCHSESNTVGQMVLSKSQVFQNVYTWEHRLHFRHTSSQHMSPFC